MTDTTALHRALDCIDEERHAVADRAAAFEAFAERVREVPTDSAPAPTQQVAPATPKAMATAVQPSSAPSTRGERCVTVREAFAETVRPHSIAADEDSLVAAIAAELTDEIAVTLAAETGWTPTLKAAVLEEVATQRRKAELLRETLQSERRTIEDAIEVVDEIVAWLQATADESLLQCGFDDLRAKHEQLEAYRERLDALTEKRQAQFTDATTHPGSDGYRELVAAIYAGLSVRFPLLSTATRLYGICGDCQRTVEAHLARRV